MKKYIVYDDNVYEIKINEEYKKNGIINYYYIQTSPNTSLLLDEDDVKQCKQANTIEELCDEFVLVRHEKYSRNTLLRDYSIEDIKNLKNREVYGATWTDKGLVYVAKLNKDGVLELI